jgi:hypothetical protein
MQATVPLFSTLCEYPDKGYVIDLFENAFPHFFQLLNTNSVLVIKNTLKGYIRISETYP